MWPSEDYTPLDRDGGLTARRSSNTTEFLTRCFLGAREEAEFPSNERGFDEDVNVYVVGLLERFLDARYHVEVARYLHGSDLDLAREARRSGDDRHRFRLYKTNADHLLLAIGIFRNVPGAQNDQHSLMHREPEEFVGRGGTYYNLASSSLRRLHRRPTAAEAVMVKLAGRFGEYVGVLRRVRTSYFHLTERIGEGTLYHLERTANEEPVSPEVMASLYDGFLDCFSAWKAQPSEELRRQLAASVESLRAADPDFAFQIPEPGDINSSE